jgi:PAS domain S-box-containing protein
MEERLEGTDVNDLSRVVDALPGLVWTALPDGDIDFLNHRWCEYTGLSAEAAQGRGWQAAVHPDDLHLLLERWPSEMAGGTRGEMEARLRRFDGEYRWFLFRTFGLTDASGQIEKWCGMNTDIDDRRHAEKDLHTIETNHREFVESFPGLVVTMSALGKVELFSSEILEYFGKTREELRSWQMNDAVHPDDLPRVIAAFTESVSNGTPYSIEHRCRRADGVYRWFQVRALAVRDENRQITGWYVVMVDIDDLKRGEEALNVARSELAHVARVATLSTFTASIAHEVNQPLSGIITNASTCLRMLDADPPNVDGARETARRTIRDANRASDVVTRLRALFSKKEFTLEPLDLNEATREVIALSLSELHRDGVIVQSELADDLPPASGDRVELQLVIRNLLRNASDAMAGVDDRPRQLTVRTELDEEDRVRLSVQDVGVGFEPHNLDKLFVPFFTTKAGGMGIGLSVSRSIIESHHGRLSAASNDGRGATFSFSIPRSFEAVRIT